jgi:hypothetical protein
MSALARNGHPSGSDSVLRCGSKRQIMLRLRDMPSTCPRLASSIPPRLSPKRSVCYRRCLMRRLRQFVRLRSRGGLLTVFIAYSLAIQAMMASVGLGMSTDASPDRAGFVLCSFAFHQTAHEPTQDGGRQKPSPVPQCPFCFVAAQSAGHIATMGEAPAFPAYAGTLSAAILAPIGAGAFVFQLHHRNGEPRAPPAFSV